MKFKFRFYFGFLTSLILLSQSSYAQTNKELNYLKYLDILDRNIKKNNQDSVLSVSKLLKSQIKDGNSNELSKKVFINNLMVGAYRIKNYDDSAFALSKENISILKEAKDTISASYCTQLISIGEIQLESLKKYNDARNSFKKAEVLFKNNSDSTSINYLRFLSGIGLVENLFSNFNESQVYLNKAVFLNEELVKKSNGSFKYSYVRDLTNLSFSFQGLGKFNDALVINFKSKKYLESFGRENTYDYYLNEYNIGITLTKLGKYVEAEKILLYGYENVIKNNLGRSLQSRFLEGLSAVYFLLGDRVKSENYNQIALNLNLKEYKNVSDFSQLFQKANIFQSKGDFSEAYKTNKFIVDQIEKLGLPKGKEYLQSLLALSTLSGLTENIPKLSFEDRKKYLLEAAKLTPKLFGNVSNENADVYANFGWFYYYTMFDDKSAITNYNLAISIINGVIEENRNKYALLGYYNQIAQAYENIGEYKLAYSALINSNLIKYKLLNEQLPFVSELEREKLLSDNQEENNRIKAYVRRNFNNLDPQSYIPDLLIIDEFYGSLSLNYAVKIRKLLESYPDEIKSKYLKVIDEDLSNSKTDVKDLAIVSSSESNNSKRELIKIITDKISGFKIQNTYSKIIAKSNFDGAIVIFQRYKSDRVVSKSNLYSCLILSKNKKVFKYLSLFQESSLDSLLSKSHLPDVNIVESIKNLYSKENKSLFRSNMDEIFNHLKNFDKVVIVPAGKLNFVNFGAFELEDGSNFGENHQLVYYNSLSEFIDDEKVDTDFRFDAIDIFSGLNYNIESTRSGFKNNLSSSYQINLKQFNDFSTKLRSFNNSWGYLPGSKIEGNSIKSIFESTNRRQFKVQIFENGEGDESIFRKLVTNNYEPKILHLSTHGFFFEKFIDNKATTSFINPSLRSGLILSGGNNGWKNFDINKLYDDGVLTAYEISKLTFKNIKLVVLSACDTGLGDIQSDEGVFGLQRAFKIAGAEKIVMSLWKVPDLQTTELMSYFYHNLVDGQTVNKSLENAQRSMKLKYSPFYWAAFKLLN
ncbi:MAG: CHAT domain-containing protein [Aquirufa sp.]